MTITKRGYIATLLTGAALAGLAQSAFAQTAPASTPTEATPQTGDDAQSGAIADIVVTAQKRSQNLQSVPVAVSAIDSNMLKAKGITDTSDLMGALPSLQITTPYGKTQPNFSLRGVSVANEFAASTASPVGVYVDEVYQSFRASHGQQLFDLDRVEVLRGPQGTLYGRNTTGGAISFFTKGPDLGRNNGYLTLGYGNYDTKTAEGALELTLVPDELGIRVAGTYSKGDGWLYNLAQNRHIGTTDSLAGRATIRWKPSDRLDIRLKVYGARDNPLAATPFALGQLAGGRDDLGYSRFDPAQNGGAALGDNEINSNSSGHYFTDSYGAALTIKYDLSDHLTVTSITGYDHGRYRNSPFDCDGSPNDVCSLRYYSSSSNFNQDTRFNYKDGAFNLTAGLYYGRDKVYTHNQPDFFGVLRPLLLAGMHPARRALS
jgi:iron complex outermembrane receptor protein